MAKTKYAVPKGYNTVTTYLAVNGANDVLTFINKAFGGEVSEKHLNDDGSIMHAEVKIGDTRLMVGEACRGEPRPAMLYMYVPDCDAVYKKALKAGAKAVMEPADQFYGDRSGSVSDRAGNQWWIASRTAGTPKPKAKAKKTASKTKKKK